MQNKKAKSVSEVLLWYPNLIGYVRVLCMVASFHFLWERQPFRFLGFYMAAFAGDLVDGWVARKFGQSEKILLHCSLIVLDIITSYTQSIDWHILISFF